MAANTLTLIAAPQASAQIETAAETVAEGMRRLGAHVERCVWLAPGVACDLPFDDIVPDQADAVARLTLSESAAGYAIDVVAQRSEERRKRLLLADMESTIIVNEMLDELADLLGMRAVVAEITNRAMNGEIAFAPALRERVALLKDMPQSALDEAGRRIRLMPGARALVATMRANGAHAVLVSGGFHHYTQRVRAELGFDRDVANELIIENGRIAGRVREPILGRDSKLDTLKRSAAEYGVPLSATLAVGD